MPQDPFYTQLPTAQILVDGIFKGGGTAGVAYAGALMALARNGIWLKRVAGTSAGSITASIIAAGYDASECDYLASPSGMRSGAPQNLPSEAEPLDYMSLLDLPLSPGELTISSRRNNLIYYAIEGATINELLKLPVSLPGLEPFITKIVNDILAVIPAKVGPFKVKVGPFEAKAGPFKVKVLGQNVKVGPWTIKTGEYEVEVGPFPVASPLLKQMVRSSVEAVLKEYPRILSLAQSGLFSTEALRQLFADAVMSAILITDPLLVVYLNFMGDGGLFKGDAFLKAIRGILQAKIGKSPVLFRDLKMDFACVACDISARKIEVFSTQTTPDTEVAEAVRRSMSIPFFFEPRRDGSHEILDGGTMDNYPVGFYLAKDNGYFINSDADMKRVKVGFSPGTLGFGPPEEVDKMLAEMIPVGGINPVKIVEVKAINRAVNVALTNMQQSPLLEAMLRQYKGAANFYEIGIDSGHGATDFHITKAKFKDMCFKGWNAAIPVAAEIVAPAGVQKC